MRKPKQEKHAYDARIALWLSRDPIGEADGSNIYAYVKNDPVNYFDPDGQMAQAAVVRWSAGQVFAAGAAAVLMWDTMREESVSQQALEETLRGIEARRNTCPAGAETMDSKSRHERTDTGLAGLSDAEVSAKARDRKLSGEERRRYQKEEKIRGPRNKQKRNSD